MNLLDILTNWRKESLPESFDIKITEKDNRHSNNVVGFIFVNLETKDGVGKVFTIFDDHIRIWGRPDTTISAADPEFLIKLKDAILANNIDRHAAKP